MRQLYDHESFRIIFDSWGEADSKEVAQLLDLVLSEFYIHLDRTKIPNKQVHIASSGARTPPADYSDIFNTKAFAFIYLSAKDRNWRQYISEFSHELCHFIIDSENYNKQHKFGWVEESLCELASWFVIHEMNIGWQIFPPIDELQEFASSLREYADNIFPLQEFEPQKPFSEWLRGNLPELSKNRYLRHKNLVIAAQLFPLFISQTSLWTSIQYLNQISDSEELQEFLYQWKEILPMDLQGAFNEIVTLFLGEK